MYNFFMGDVQLPVAPPSMSMKINSKNETIVLINEGEVNILKKAGLTEIEFEAEFPNNKYPYAVYPNGYRPALFFLEHFEKLKISQEPFQFIVNRLKPNGSLIFDTNMIVSLEDYTIDEDAENGFDVKSTIRLKQFKPFGTKKLKLDTSTTGTGTAQKTAKIDTARSTTGKETAKTHTVKSGDTLWAIAKKHLGDGSKQTQLAKLNNIANPNLIKVVQVIKLG